MTITSTEELLVRPDAEPIPATTPAAPERAVDPTPRAPVIYSPWTEAEVEEPEPPRTRLDWLTLFAWARTAGGW